MLEGASTFVDEGCMERRRRMKTIRAQVRQNVIGFLKSTVAISHSLSLVEERRRLMRSI